MNVSEENGTEYIVHPYKVLEIPELVPLMGYVYPFLSVLTMVANSVVIGVFLKKKMRTPTSVLLIGLAVSDSISCMSLVPHQFYLLTLGNQTHYMPYGWCLCRHFMLRVNNMFHTTSNWITVSLGIQRYIVVRFPFSAKRICSKKCSVFALCFSLLLGTLLYTNELFAIKVLPFQPVDPSGENLTMALGCIRQINPDYIDVVIDMKKSITMHLIFSGLLSRFLPCVLLIIATVLLIYELKKEQKIMGLIIDESRKSKKNKKQITKFVVAILLIFLISEMQDAVAYAIYVIEIATDNERKIISNYVDQIWHAIGITFTLIGCHSNFWIYLLMSSQFRKTLKGCLSSVLPESTTTTMSTGLASSKRKYAYVTEQKSTDI